MSTNDTPQHPPSPGPAGPQEPSSDYAPLPASEHDAADASPRASMLDPPNPQFFSQAAFFGGPGVGLGGSQTPRDSVATSNPQSLHDNASRNGSNTALALGAGAGLGLGAGAAAADEGAFGSHAEYNEKGTNSYPSGSGSGRRKRLLLFGGLAALVIIAAAVAIPVGIVVSNNNKKSKSSSDTSSGNGGSSGGSNNPSGSNSPSNKNPTTGGDGSTVTTDDGSTFTYVNKFGGIWVDDPEDPFNNNAQPNSWTPPLNTSWTWGKDKVYGYVFRPSSDSTGRSS